MTRPQRLPPLRTRRDRAMALLIIAGVFAITSATGSWLGTGPAGERFAARAASVIEWDGEAR